MDSELLRRACEVVGGNRTSQPLEKYGPNITIWSFGDCGLWESHPALPAYVASLLVAKVREMGPGPGLMNSTQKALHLAYCSQFTGLPPGYMVATDEQRIRAAMEVLDGQ